MIEWWQCPIFVLQTGCAKDIFSSKENESEKVDIDYSADFIVVGI